MHLTVPPCEKYDITIIGGGGAGMCLLWALIHSGYVKDTSILVIEPEEKNRNDRTWCFWAREDDLIVRELSALLSNKWDTAVVNGQIKPITPYSYYHLESKSFYDHVRKLVAQNPQIKWVPERVLGVCSAKQPFAAVTTTRATYNTTLVFDSRITNHQLEYIRSSSDFIWQSFFGYRIKLKNKCLDTDAFHFMDFGIEQNGHCQFVYILPFAGDEALVELTRFGCHMLDEPLDGPLLQSYIKNKFGDFEIMDHEQGAIPMDPVFNARSPYYASKDKHILIGTPSGCVKSTTGYAFHTMFNYSYRMVHALEKGRDIPTVFRPSRFRFYDGLLLHLLKKRPQEGAQIFTKLFNATPVLKVLKFLDEQSSFLEEMPLLWSLPKRLFMLALLEKMRKL
jgi:lycopene beta-cyclase